MLVNLAVIQELIAAHIPDRQALAWRDRTFTYADLTARTRRLGRALLRLGLGCRRERRALEPWESGHDHVAVYCHNGNEWIEAMYGAWKARAAFVNVNYRYVADELRYVLETSAARAIIYHATFAPLLAAVRRELPALRHFVQVRDDSGHALLPDAVDYEEWLAAEPPDPIDLPYSADDLYVLFTGGTTGMPKGVLWRHEDVFFNGLGGHVPGFERLDSEAKLLGHLDAGLGGRFLVLPPFMHGAGQWATFNTFHRGGTVILPDEVRRFDAHATWRTIERQRVDQMSLVGDAFARPLLAALREGAYDSSSVRVISSTAAVLSPAVKRELASLLPDGTMFIESIGATEAGLQAMSWDAASGPGGHSAYQLRDNSVLLSDDRRRALEPGSDEVGWLATRGHLPLGYLGDPERTRRTFPVIDGVRYCIGGDRARWAEDGRMLFLGRDSACINTGGEKVYAEEVERVVKGHPSVEDALVVGVRDPRWGQRVTAVMSVRDGGTAVTVDELRAHCAPHLADYKIPRAVVVTAEIVRSPSGKPDYAWAKAFAEESSCQTPIRS
ncbi:MAG: acyl-CoA synthetase [Deltaproteobacteria bacterium]|nr:MAG: acyl-CoA synthetase [Deltaproteobacteria bacterium]